MDSKEVHEGGGVRNGGGNIRTKWQGDDGGMGHVYPQEGESGKDETGSGGSRRLKGHSFYRKKKLRDIDVRRGDRDEERQLGEKERASGSEKKKG